MRQKRITILVLLIVSFISSVPFLTSYVPFIEGHDLAFHLFRIQGLADALQERSFPVRMQYAQMQGYGYPVSIMYGDLFLLLPAVLVNIGLSVTHSYNVFAIAVNVATCVIAYFCMAKVFDSCKIGIFAATLWTLAPYRLLDVYVRAAVGEYLSLAFFPLVMLGVFSIFRKSREKRAVFADLDWLWAPVGICAILYSHIISTFIAALIAVPVLAIGLAINHDKSVFAKLGLSIAAFLLLSAAFLVPFLDFYIHEDLSVGGGDIVPEYLLNRLRENLLQPAQLFMLATPMTGRGAHLEDGIAADMPYNIGWSLLACGILAILIIVCLDKKQREERKMLCGISVSALAIASILYFLTTTLAPWGRVDPDSVLGKLICVVAQIQCAWRLLGMADFLLLVSGCCALKMLLSVRARIVRIILVLIAVFASIEGGLQATSFSVSAQPLFSFEAISGEDGVGAGEYLPASFHRGGAMRGLQVDDGLIVTAYSQHGTTISFEYRNAADSSSAELPLLYYSPYDIISNDSLEESQNRSEAQLVESSDGVVQIDFDGEGNGRIDIGFITPISWDIAFAVSLFFGGALIVALVGSRVIAAFCNGQQQSRNNTKDKQHRHRGNAINQIGHKGF